MISFLIDSLRWVHILAGAIGLIAFWIPLFMKKGSINHKAVGKIFINAGYIVVVAGLLVLALKFTALYESGQTFQSAKAEITLNLFLGYLCLTTAAILRHGVLVLSHKKQQTLHGTFTNYAFSYSCLAGSIGIILFGLIAEPDSAILLYAMSPVGFITHFKIYAYISGRRTSKQQWWYEHLSALIIAGIAFHTAFAVFGSTRFIDLGLSGTMAIVPWLAPTFVGVPAMIIWELYYRKKFNDPISSRGAKTEATA